MLRYAFRAVLVAIAGSVLAVYLVNASWLAPEPQGEMRIVAHRGVHQTYNREGLTTKTCTAERIFEPTHGFIENTLPSIREAFRLGADMVEIDIHVTKDGEFAVFHDWTVDCRTEGRGRTIDHTMAELKALDLGYGYTADGGKTYPLRGRGVGMMKTLDEVLDTFPGRAFLINAKANNARDAEVLDAYLRARPGEEGRELIFFGGPKWVARWRELRPGSIAMGKADAKACVKSYLLTGWSGVVPDACGSGIGIPMDLRHFYWGWPDRLQARFADGEMVMMTGAVRSIGGGTGGIDTLEEFGQVPRDFTGYVMTNRIEVIGPAAAARREAATRP